MIERKKYLELCKINSVNPKSVVVELFGILYYPISLNIWFNENGEVQNTAILKDVNACSFMNCRLQDLILLDNDKQM